MDWIFIFLAVVCPILGFIIHGMKDADHQVTPTLRDRIYGFGSWLGGVGLVTFMFWLVLLMWSISTKTDVTIANMSFLLFHAAICVSVGGLIMGASRSQRH